MTSFLNVVRDLALLLARVGLGVAMVIDGWNRWQAPGQGVQQQIEFLGQFGTPYANFAAWANIALELIGGIFLIAGFLTPLVAAAVIAQQVLMIAYTNWFRGWDLLTAEGVYNGGYEYNVLIALLAVLLMVFGAGRISIDRIFHRPKSTTADEEGYAGSGGSSDDTRVNMTRVSA